MDEASRIVENLTAPQRRALIEAEQHKDGEVYARAYSVPDRFTKAYRVYGLGDPLNRVGLAVRQRLMENQS